MPALGFTQAHLDALTAAYAKAQISGAVSIEGRSWSWSYGSMDQLWNVIQQIHEDLVTQSGTGRKRYTLVQFNRNL